MALYTMADTHLSKAVQKPMDIFGSRWLGFENKIHENWMTTVKNSDTVIIPGDISWGMNLEEAKADLLYIDSLPGKKIILKGNHDFWWQTASKLNEFCQKETVKTLHFLQNNAFSAENFIICGSRGWYTEDRKVVAQNAPEAEKIINREIIRLRLSLEQGKKLQTERFEQTGIKPEILVFFHFPPYFTDYICDEIVLELYRYDIKRCYFGHIHGVYDVPQTLRYMDIDFSLVSADYLNFKPLLIQ